MQAYCLTARLKYVHGSSPVGATTLKYEIEIGASRSDIPDIPLFPDYVLAKEGRYKITDGSFVLLLLIHPQVALVLVLAESTPDLNQSKNRLSVRDYLSRKIARVSGAITDLRDLKKREAIADHNLQVEEGKGNILYERIGIVRVSNTLLGLYNVDWMRGAGMMKVSIV